MGKRIVNFLITRAFGVWVGEGEGGWGFTVRSIVHGFEALISRQKEFKEFQDVFRVEDGFQGLGLLRRFFRAWGLGWRWFCVILWSLGI